MTKRFLQPVLNWLNTSTVAICVLRERNTCHCCLIENIDLSSATMQFFIVPEFHKRLFLNLTIHTITRTNLFIGFERNRFSTIDIARVLLQLFIKNIYLRLLHLLLDILQLYLRVVIIINECVVIIREQLNSYKCTVSVKPSKFASNYIHLISNITQFHWNDEANKTIS